MTDQTGRGSDALEAHLLGLIDSAREQASEDPFRNPVLAVTLAITRAFDRGEIAEADLDGLFARLRTASLGARAQRLRDYVGLDQADAAAVASELVAAVPDRSGAFEDFARLIHRTAFAVVFTAHPTFGMPQAVASLLAQAATARETGRREELVDRAAALSTRPDVPISLDVEFEQACAAANNARLALDAFNGALVDAARRRWPERWTELSPRPFAVASWVGCDTDGRTDIGWWDTLRYRLISKRMQFDRVMRELPDIPAARAARGLAEGALSAVNRQLAVAPRLGDKPSLEAVHRFSLALIIERERAQTDAAPLVTALNAALEGTQDEADRRAIAVLRAGVETHGLSNALPHFRLNASQIHNAVRRVIDLDGEPTDAARRRSHLATIHSLLDDVRPVAVDFGALAAERASAARLMMTIAQILKHVDGTHPVRFLIAETETGYTLLAALWLARHYGIADKLEITPLFETASALEQGIRVLDDALRNPHWRAYIKRIGRLTVQFGYSDSGRYVGQLAATFWIERLRLRITEMLVQNGLAEVELAIFDTHGESIGRGAHPTSLRDRLAYLAPEDARDRARKAGLKVRLESSFQGTDGYLLFGTRELADASLARIAEHVYALDIAEEDAFAGYALSEREVRGAAKPTGTAAAADDPIYSEPDFALEFFTVVRQEMESLVDDTGYAALLGTFGPSLLDRTGSRPVARQTDSGGPARITHPRQMRAIPNNAILHQLGFGELFARARPGGGAGAGPVPRHAPGLGALLPRLPPRAARGLRGRPRRAARLRGHPRSGGVAGAGAADAEGFPAGRTRGDRGRPGAPRPRLGPAPPVRAAHPGLARPPCRRARPLGHVRPADPASRPAARPDPPDLVPRRPHPRVPAPGGHHPRADAGALPAPRHRGLPEDPRRDLPQRAGPDARSQLRRARRAARHGDLRGGACHALPADSPDVRTGPRDLRDDPARGRGFRLVQRRTHSVPACPH